jgi:hypothetical protein
MSVALVSVFGSTRPDRPDVVALLDSVVLKHPLRCQMPPEVVASAHPKNVIPVVAFERDLDVLSIRCDAVRLSNPDRVFVVHGFRACVPPKGPRPLCLSESPREHTNICVNRQSQSSSAQALIAPILAGNIEVANSNEPSPWSPLETG